LAVGVFPRLKSDVVFVVALIMASAVIGYGVNAVRVKPLPWVYRDRAERLIEAVEKLNPPKQLQGSAAGAPDEAIRLKLDEFLKLGDDKSVVVLDARPAFFSDWVMCRER
jgi:hypothetical protein